MVKVNDAIDHHEHEYHFSNSDAHLLAALVAQTRLIVTLNICWLYCYLFVFPSGIISKSFAALVTKAVISVPVNSAPQPSKHFPQS